MATISNQRIRRAAILIASIDPKLGMTLLASLAPEEADRVRTELQSLGEIDPAERDSVLQAFRTGQAAAPVALEGPASEEQLSGVELKLSTPSTNGSDQGETAEPQVRNGSSALDSADVDVVAEFLNREHAQTVAVVLSRMCDDRAAAVFAALQDEVKPDVLSRLSTLEPADEQAVLELESHICSWVEEHRQRKQRAQAGVEMVNRILAKTPEATRAELLLRMSPDESRSAPTSTDAGRSDHRDVGQAPEAARLAKDFAAERSGVAEPIPLQFAPSLSRISAAQQLQPSLAPLDGQSSSTGAASLGGVEPGEDALADRSALLQRLDCGALMQALASVDEMTARLALAGSSEAVLQRVLRKLTWRRARALRKQLRWLPPTPVAQMRLAQLAVLREAQALEARRGAVEQAA